MEVEAGGASSSSPSPNSSSSLERLVAIVLALVAILSPLFIDRRRTVYELEDEADIQSMVSTWLPVLMVGLMVAVAVSLHLDRRFTNFDPYWIHRVGGSSGGIIVVLIVLVFVLKCRATGIVAVIN